MEKENLQEAKDLALRLEDDYDEMEKSQEKIVKTLLEGEKDERIECDISVMGENGCYTVGTIRLSNYGMGVMTPLCEIFYPACSAEVWYVDLSISERQEIINALLDYYKIKNKRKRND